jgi:hypothetical protein
MRESVVKKLIVIALALVSMNSMAALNEYTGSNNGAACIVKIDLSEHIIEMANIKLNIRKEKRMGLNLILEGGVGFTEEKITLSMNSEKEFTAAKLEVKVLLMPTFTTKQVCSNLVRTK